MASSFQHLSIIMTNKSASVWPSLVKWAATGDSSMRIWAMLKRWRFIRERRGCPVSPTYWKPHLLHCINYITLNVLQEARSFSWKRSLVALLENVSVVTNMVQVLHLLASQRKLPWGSLILDVISTRTSRSRRFLRRRKAQMGKDGNAFWSQSESCRMWW